MGEFTEFYYNCESDSDSDVEDSICSSSEDSSDEDYEPVQKKRKISTTQNLLLKKRTSIRGEKINNKKEKKKTGACSTRSKIDYQNKSGTPRSGASSSFERHTGASSTRSKIDYQNKDGTSKTSAYRNERPMGSSKHPKASVLPTKPKNIVSAGKKKRKRLNVTTTTTIQQKNKEQVNGWKHGHFTPTLFDFDASASGLSPNVPQSSNYDELFFFELFFDDKLVDMIVEESNRYHETIPIRCKDSNKRKHQKAWEPIDRKEMYVFLATFMLMSAVKKSKMQEYWSTDPLIETPIFKKIMPRDRFLEILRALHFNDNEKQVPGDRLFKIKPVMELLKDRFPFFINAYKNLAIDESLMLWKGRLCFKQFISSKRHRFGVKLFILCDCSTGAILDFIVYTGSTTEMTSYEELGISGSVVMTLLQPYLGKGHSVFLDNWYSSPKLYDELHKQLTGACGTVRKNRQNMPQFENLQKGEIIHLHKNNLMALKWQDKRDVHMLSTLHEPGFGPTKKKNYKDDTTIWKPFAIIDYNANMGPIDKSDMQISFVECVRKSVKWYKKFFFHLVDMTVFNCNIMATIQSGQKCGLGKFRNELVRKLLSKYGQTQTPKQRIVSAASTPYPKRLIDRHFPSKISSDGSTRLRTRTCFVCSHSKKKENKRSSSRFECIDCNVGLCVSDCFREYHTLLHF